MNVVAQEPKLVALYEAVLEELDLAPGTRLLDLGCGAGLFLRLAAQRGAEVAGIDAEVAREALPFGDDEFDVVTVFALVADPTPALHEAARVAAPGRPIVIATWGRLEDCEAAAAMRALGAKLPGIAQLAACAQRGGLVTSAPRAVTCVWDYEDDAALLRALGATDAAAAAVLDAVAPYRTSAGGYRLENTFNYIIARKDM